MKDIRDPSHVFHTKYLGLQGLSHFSFSLSEDNILGPQVKGRQDTLHIISTLFFLAYGFE